MENVDVDGTPFSVLMDRAVKLKTQQTKHERTKYDGLPSFYANTVFPREEAVAARQLNSFDDRLAAATRMKDEGNVAFREGRLSEALAKYELSLSVFRFLENTNPAWKTEGIKDADLKEHCCEGKTDKESKKLNRFLVNCYNNIALVSHKMANFSLAVQACDYALAVEENDKALFLRAKARIAPKISGAVELSMARSDLQAALKYNPANNEARKLLQQLNGQVKQQKQRDKRTFKGLFDRGEVYDAQVLEEDKTARRAEAEQEQVDSKDRDVVLGKQLVQLYEERGLDAEKQQLEQSLRLEEMRAMGKDAYLSSLDFRNPSTEMIRDAKSHGVDLQDAQTLALLEEMKSKYGNKGLMGAGREAAATSSSRPIPPDDKQKVLSHELVSTGKGRKCLSLAACMFLVGCCYIFLFALLRAQAMKE